jgi:hypothetical protein
LSSEQLLDILGILILLGGELRRLVHGLVAKQEIV